MRIDFASRAGGATTAFSTATDTASLVISPVADTPTVTNATTNENTQTTNGLVISRNAADGAEVTHFKITGISNGTLYKNDGTTAITNGTFITFAEGSAGLKFTPSANFSGNGSFTVQASTSSGDAGLGGSTASATITVLAVNDAPVAVGDTYSVNEDSTLVIAPSTSNLSHWWGFNEGASSQTTADAGSTPNSGTLGSTAGVDTTDPTWTTGYVGSGGLSFDGAGDYVATTSTDLKTASTFTISAWFQTDTTTGAHHIVWQGYAGGNGYGNGGSTTSATSEMSLSIGSYDLAYDNKIVFSLGYDIPANGADSIFIASASNFTDTSGWHHVAVSVTDMGGGVMSASLYVDGQLEGTDTGSQNDRSTWAPLRIGASGDGSRSFDGKIDEVRIYQSALTAAQVQALAQPGILQNDTDAELDVLNAVLASGPTNGTLALGKDGSFTYTPNANFSGVDSFTYRANDGTASSNLATVTINVNPVNDAPVATITPATYAATEQVALSLKNTGLSISDVDAASGSMTVTLSVTEGALTVTAGGSGALVSNSGTSSVTITGTVTQINNLLNTDGTSTVSYSDNTDTPSASATLTLQVNDNGNTGGGSLTNSDTATINITAVNDAPVTTPVTLAAIAEDSGARVITQAELLANASDVDGPSLTATGLADRVGSRHAGEQRQRHLDLHAGAQRRHVGELQLHRDRRQPDGRGQRHAGHHAGQRCARDHAGHPRRDRRGQRRPRHHQAQLLANASDVDGPSLTATGLAISSGSGTLVNNGNGTWTYTPALNDDTAVSFSYTVTDGSLTAAGSATLDITPVNDAPTTTPVTLARSPRTAAPASSPRPSCWPMPATSTAPSLTATNLAISSGTGTLVNNGNGTWTYTPALNDDSSVSFSYTVTDGSLTASRAAADAGHHAGQRCADHQRR